MTFSVRPSIKSSLKQWDDYFYIMVPIRVKLTIIKCTEAWKLDSCSFKYNKVQKILGSKTDTSDKLRA